LCTRSRVLPETIEARKVAIFNFKAREHAAEVGPVIPVVEQADVPSPRERVEEISQRAGTFGELEAAQALVLNLRAWPPTIWRTCSFAISLSVRSTVSYPERRSCEMSASAS
jgi:hypothetical protein